ncbi:MAG: DUF3306 domain-containing protein [Geminicoccaceae bacterium]|nr:DUF3306 domain-containing protein [Geminicoccaceae bacterium]
MTAEADGDAFLARWSRRKRAAAMEAEAAALPVPAPVPAPEDTPPPDLPPPDLPPVESLEAGSDFRPFLRANVPEALQRQALRRLWRTDPTLACLDGLVDYADDYTDAAVARPGIKTAFKVARMLDEAIGAVEGEEPAVAVAAAAPAVAATDGRTGEAGDAGLVEGEGQA